MHNYIVYIVFVKITQRII